MEHQEHDLKDPSGYLASMAKPLREKLRVASYIPQNAKTILDVGCADGTVTCALAGMFPEKEFAGIDLDANFIDIATKKAKAEGLTNITFKTEYLRDSLKETARYDSVIFVSALHEFYSYGKGISSVLKALADANELLRPGGDIIIRDMIPHAYTKKTNYLVPQMLEKITTDAAIAKRATEFTEHFGPIDTIYNLNHFLLKYRYINNWQNEVSEHYVPVTFEMYEQAFALLGMELVLRDSSLLPFLRDTWIGDFGFTEEEIAPLISTGFLVARK